MRKLSQVKTLPHNNTLKDREKAWHNMNLKTEKRDDIIIHI